MSVAVVATVSRFHLEEVLVTNAQVVVHQVSNLSQEVPLGLNSTISPVHLYVQSVFHLLTEASIADTRPQTFLRLFFRCDAHCMTDGHPMVSYVLLQVWDEGSPSHSGRAGS